MRLAFSTCQAKFLEEEIFATWRSIMKIAKISTSQKFPAIRYLKAYFKVALEAASKHVKTKGDTSPHP